MGRPKCCDSAQAFEVCSAPLQHVVGRVKFSNNADDLSRSKTKKKLNQIDNHGFSSAFGLACASQGSRRTGQEGSTAPNSLLLLRERAGRAVTATQRFETT